MGQLTDSFRKKTTPPPKITFYSLSSQHAMSVNYSLILVIYTKYFLYPKEKWAKDKNPEELLTKMCSLC